MFVPRRSNKVIGYLRVSTAGQSSKSQRLKMYDFGRKNNIRISEFIDLEISSRKSTKKRKIDDLLEMLRPGDTLIVSELSRLGRSIGQVTTFVDELIQKKIRLIAIKENIDVKPNGKKDMQTTVMISMFSLFAEIERQLISERTKAGLEAARAKGKILGRPKGSTGRTKLDGKEAIIKEDLRYGVAKAAIARKLGVSRGSLINFIKTRGLEG